MKKVVVLLMLIHVLTPILAQTIEVEYDMFLNFGNTEQFRSSLAFNNSNAYFFYQNTGNANDANTENIDNEYTTHISDTLVCSIFTSKSVDTIYEVIFGVDKKRYLIKEEIEPISWTIHNETKEIGNYLCNKATCNFRGRNYVAWFTFAIPTVFGPLKLHGLPGLILDLSDDKDQVILTAKKITPKNIEVTWHEPNCRQVTRAEYNEKLKRDIDTLMKRIASKMDRGVSISISAPKLYAIEVYE